VTTSVVLAMLAPLRRRYMQATLAAALCLMSFAVAEHEEALVLASGAAVNLILILPGFRRR
jgi:hypothetical protein